jgi:glycosyltransferase involved in cell wall biosynthesis
VLVTVAICTWNRARLLDQALEQMARLSIPPEVEWELLVVDNNCSDETPQVVLRHASHLPIVELSEPKQGLSHARNRAVDAARGDIIMWTDDDARVTPQWLGQYIDAAERRPDATFFGGPVEPWFPEPPPDWLAANLSVFSGAYALRQAPAGTTTLTGTGILPFGANFAVRRRGFEQARFDTQLGRRGNDMMGGEEVQFMEHLAEQGHFGVWVEGAKVRHYIPAERLSLRFLWNYYYDEGRSRLRMLPEADYPSRWQLARKYWKSRIKAWSGYRQQGERWARAFKAAATTRGLLDELHSRC